MVQSVGCKTHSWGSIDIRQSHDGEAGMALSNFNQSERLCFTHNTKITIIKSYYDTLMAKFMFIYVNILVVEFQSI